MSTVRAEITTIQPNRNPSNQVHYENFNEKYNVYDTEPEPKPDSGGSDGGDGGGGGGVIGGGGGRVSSASAQGTILVIGIIAGALIAIVLIVIIVSSILKDFWLQNGFWISSIGLQVANIKP